MFAAPSLVAVNVNVNGEDGVTFTMRTA